MSLKGNITKGLGWTAIGSLGKEIFAFFTLLLLLRYLSPSDFGLVNMVAVVAGFSMILMDFGFGQALIKDPEPTTLDYSSVFWLNVITGVVLSIILFFSAPLIATFYKQPDLLKITQVLSLQFFFSGFVVVQKIILQKSLNFRLLSIVEFCSIVGACIIAIIFAVRGFGYWSIVFQVISEVVFALILCLIFVPWKPSFSFSKASIKKLAGFSLDVFYNRSLFYWTASIDKILIGKFLGDTALGVYKNAGSIIFRPLSNFLGILSKVMFPALSKIQDDKEKLNKVYVEAVTGSMLMVTPLLFLIYLNIDFVVEKYLREEWYKAVGLVKLFCIALSPIIITSQSEAMFLALGKTRLMFKINILARLTLVFGVIVGLYFGLEGVVIGLFVSYFLRLILDILFFKKLINLKFFFLIKRGLKVIISIGISYLVYFIFTFHFPVESIFIFLVSNLLLITVYFLTAFLLKVETLVLLLSVLRMKADSY